MTAATAPATFGAFGAATAPAPALLAPVSLPRVTELSNLSDLSASWHCSVYLSPLLLPAATTAKTSVKKPPCFTESLKNFLNRHV